ncbi:hypothetical protein A3A93_02650 [Candidatus Roizmanbacteria bacterium RIFCSPLOWO2_01_FULL_38_12]|uniref:Hydrogenase/sulfur reductase subunit alpha n=1 Tax=Candidatus Roizmanbacteria bacterium RIFCSPLOWO2_01_FULL_38_12 TaxID=1802061 RepID=A0A1F7IUG3_9BACT|nr:MAG: hypothetical protein A2861_02730 [Candidatus Roizmanbacteria bacterium RIFCSPHIGHO2_01_FULL_38_15]OGK34359.1 MAG: hypothetical protein A3F59_04955 [Candidatus Roizmanbacteria bacterium RIFCSPHIGHO2_12_FULL_38_13]OGK46998.1 MAG: hypothetical protein A3A93_02650 [Candidatus Roizmanbacteria bacterium RIFCSPLOWO2_01_FULL_38_12]
MHQGTLDLTLDQITKIEGHASLSLKVKDDVITECKFSIPEYKRFYTQAVRKKPINSIPQMVARICGTCSNAHLLCSIKAIEASQGIIPSEQTKILRRILVNGLMIRDHGLHLYVFALPDIYKRDSLLDFDENDHEEHELLHDAFAVKEGGNQLAIWAGGRSVHAPNPTVGGFLKLPLLTEKDKLISQLKSIRPRVLKLISIFQNCDFVQEEDVSFSALQSTNFDFLDGSIVTAGGKRIIDAEYASHLEHIVIPYSQASGYKFEGKTYIVGALARVNLSKQFLNPATLEDASEALKLFPSKNIYHNNLAQAIEILHCIDDSIAILEKIHIQDEKPARFSVKPGIGVGVVEAPRGTLYHRYEVDDKGIVTNGRIIVPTGQNQIAIEQSLYHFAKDHLETPKEELSLEFEKIVRAYDPCMSCASHFLKLKIIRKVSR